MGVGSYAVVYFCFCDGFYQRGKLTVLKELYPCPIDSSKRIIRELEIWASLSHKNVVQFYGIVRPKRLMADPNSLQLSFLLENVIFLCTSILKRLRKNILGFTRF
jgi:serine/threonine protein kinase